MSAANEITSEQVAEFQRCVQHGDVVLFPTDTVYGLGCDPENRQAVERLYRIKNRPLDKPSAVLFFALEPALAAITTGPKTLAALRRLLPGPVTVLLPNRTQQFPLACGANLELIGLRVPALPPSLSPLAAFPQPLLQSSANLADGQDPAKIEAVAHAVRTAVDCVVDGGELPGHASTVVNLQDYERDDSWKIIRQGAYPFAELKARLDD
jgi:L-threonylcarbamoyladenylate synthase